MTGNNKPMDEHLHSHAIEDVLFLMEGGLSFDLACVRIGRSRSAMARLFERHHLPNPANKVKEPA